MSFIHMRYDGYKKPRYFKEKYDYITDDVKSEGLIGANGCSISNAVQSMDMMKKLVHKTGGRQIIEVIVSMTPDTGSISDKSYLGAAENIASLFSDYQSYFAVHKDTNIRHIHIIINTINFKTGLKFTQSKSELNQFRRKVNCILEAYGFDISKQSADSIWVDNDYSENMCRHLEIEEYLPPSRRFDMEIQPMADPLQIEDIVQGESLDFNTEKALPWYYNGNGEYKNPDYPSIADAAAGAVFGLGSNCEPNSLMSNPDLLANFHNPFEEALRLPRSQRWNSQQSPSPYLNSLYNRRRVPAMYRNQPSMSAPAYFTPPAPTFGGQTNHYPYCQEPPYVSQPEWGTPNMYGNQAFSPVPPYPNQPTPGFQDNPYSSYFSCPPNSSPYCQGSSQGSQFGWGTQDMHGNQPFMPMPTYPNQPISYFQGSSYGSQPEWGTQDIYGNQPPMPIPPYSNYTAPPPLWQPPVQTSYPPDTPYGTFAGNGYVSQYQPDSPPQSMSSFMPQNPYPSVGVSIGNAYEINATVGIEPENIVQLVQGLLKNESEQRPTLGANIVHALQKAAFQQGMHVNCFADASPRIVINLTEQPNQSDDENNTSNMIDTTLTDTE